MKLSISNIAWNKDEDIEVYRFLYESRVKFIDIAPGRIFNDPMNPQKSELKTFKDDLKKYDLSVAGMQALVFGREDLTIFGDKKKNIEFIDYLKKIIDLGNSLGASTAVFGSPKNRLVGDKKTDDVYKIAVDFFSKISEYSKNSQITVCIEPNPEIYGADFITKTEEAFELVKQINHEYFKMNLDLGTIIANEEKMSVLEKNVDLIGHAHISEPYLKPISSDYYKEFVKTLYKSGYEKYIAIEMAKVGDKNINNIKEVIKRIKTINS